VYKEETSTPLPKIVYGLSKDIILLSGIGRTISSKKKKK